MAELEKTLSAMGNDSALNMTSGHNEVVEQIEEAKERAWFLRKKQTAYSVGDKVILPNKHTYDKVLECTTAGTTSETEDLSTQVNFEELEFEETVTDGTVVWTCRKRTSVVIDNLISTSTTDSLSANQGRVLNESKQDTLTAGDGITITGATIKANVINNLTSTSETDALSAAQGKALKDTKQDNLTAGDGINITGTTIKADVINNLTSTSTTKPLSAAKGKELKDTKQDNLTAGAGITIDNNVISTTGRYPSGYTRVFTGTADNLSEAGVWSFIATKPFTRVFIKVNVSIAILSILIKDSGFAFSDAINYDSMMSIVLFAGDAVTLDIRGSRTRTEFLNNNELSVFEPTTY